MVQRWKYHSRCNRRFFSCNESGVYKVEVANQDCTAEDSIEITFGELQTNADTFILEETDFDGDGFETFDLTEIEPLVVDNYEEMTYDYYSTIEDAENQNNPIADQLLL